MSTQLIIKTKQQYPINKSKGAIIDLTSTFINERKIAQQKKQKGSALSWSEEQNILRERFKPLNQKFGNKKRKEKIDDDELEHKRLASSTLSDESANNQIDSQVDSGKHKQKNNYEQIIPMLPTKASSDSVDDENSNSKDSGISLKILPPIYIDIQEEIENKFFEAEDLFKKLKKKQQKRLEINFNLDEKKETELQHEIFDMTHKITQLLKQCEQSLKKLRNSQQEKSVSQQQIKQSIMSILATKLKDLTQQFKNNEKQHYEKVKDFHGEEDNAKMKKQKILDDQYFEQQLAQNSQSLQPQYKDEEIQNIVKSINDLASIFKELSVLVVEQGTILDRIDYNVEAAKEATIEANIHLQAVQENERSTRAIICIKCQVATIVVLLLVVLIKFTL